ncbi:topoisomerase II [Ruania alkalisoli]|uniref:Topoisomerase II n=1 Tax=Ruania alkalisoli TaxID=2779775 RepID=A0A7M1SW66_9MICO|nr:DUF5926 family protein [Ruania alkalisoli]QOR71204.1 topoisomerase II [Ruania alkalisoli]
MAKRKKQGPVNEKVAARRAARKAAKAAGGAVAPRRSFEGLPGEADWVAMREVVPAASATARTTAEHGSRDVTVVTVLPGLLPAMHREDGQILVALQNVTSSGDPSRDVAAALLQVLDSEPGTSLTHLDLPGPGPRLQDVLDLDAPFEVTLHETFDFVLPPDSDPSPEVNDALEEFAGAIVPTVKLSSVEGAYWCRMGAREFLRWSRTEDEEQLLDALARLHAERHSAVDDGARFIGAFRSCGLVVPVWELEPGTEAEELEKPAPQFEARLAEALAVTDPLNAEERRARAGIVSRQVTLR